MIDPRRIELARYAKYHLQLKPSTNVALLNMMMHYIIKEGLVDQDFVDRRTEGLGGVPRQLLALDVDKMEQVTGVDRELVRQAAIAYAKSPPP
ncbi:MAG: molybdopterin-dependent oxidoreductase [Flavobacteriales bacterium]